MASTDYPFSVTSKFIDDSSAEHLVTVRAATIADFQKRLVEASEVFPYAGFSTTDAIGDHPDHPSTDAIPDDPQPAPTPIKQSPTQNAHRRAATASAAQKDAAPKCPVHVNAFMRRSKFPPDNPGWYCTQKTEDGYCNEKRDAA